MYKLSHCEHKIKDDTFAVPDETNTFLNAIPIGRILK